MRLQPNAPRMVTVIVAIALCVIGVIYAWPIGSLFSILDPFTTALASVGLTMGRDLAYLCLFASPTLLVVGSLVPGI